MSHTLGYGALIALGLLNHVKGLNNSPEDIEKAEAYRSLWPAAAAVLPSQEAERSLGRGSMLIPVNAWRCA